MNKYKESIPGWFFKIHLDKKGEELSRQEFKENHAFYKEMIDSGLDIEPQFTAEELEAKEIKETRDSAKNKESEIATAKREAAIYLNELQIDSDPDCITKARQQFNDSVAEIESRY